MFRVLGCGFSVQALGFRGSLAYLEGQADLVSALNM